MSSSEIKGKKYFPLDSEQRLNWLRLIRSEWLPAGGWQHRSGFRNV